MQLGRGIAMEVVNAKAAGMWGLRSNSGALGGGLSVKAGDDPSRIDLVTSPVYVHRFRQLFSLECKTLFN